MVGNETDGIVINIEQTLLIEWLPGYRDYAGYCGNQEDEPPYFRFTLNVSNSRHLLVANQECTERTLPKDVSLQVCIKSLRHYTVDWSGTV